MVTNLLDRELIPITREHTENACTTGYCAKHVADLWSACCNIFKVSGGSSSWPDVAASEI